MIKKYIFCLLALFFTHSIPAQTLSQAKRMFENNNYEKAKAAFAKLIRRSPNSAEMNYYYGASLYETGELEKSIPYLEKSAKRNYIGAFRYLGKAYADAFRFDEAMENYDTHIDWLEEKKRDTGQAEAELAELRKKARILKNVEMVTVIDSFVVSKQELMNTYKIGLNSGKIRMNENKDGTIYENEIETKRIVSEKKGSFMQLYTQSKLLDGWSEKEPIQSLNSNCNVNFPFLMGDGTTIYYASDGEGSLGGYDIFVSRYDPEDKAYLRPGNIGAPFNSTANDYLYVIDEQHNLGWFATDRNQPDGFVCIYVFIPNEIKRTYNYENYPPEFIKNVATLANIRTTWNNKEEVNEAKKCLASIMKSEDKSPKHEDGFRLIINDNETYTKWNDFRSKEAQNAFRQLKQKEKDLNQLQSNLDKERQKYTSANESGKKELEPYILELEKRIPQLTEELEKLILDVRRLEMEKLKK